MAKETRDTPERRARWERIEQLVLAFQSGNTEAALAILEAMQPYLLKYIRLVRQAYVNWRDPDARRFVSLLLPEPELRRAILRRNPSLTQCSRALHFLRMLASAVRPIPQADLEQEMKAILLELARRYRPMPHRNFVGYVAGRRGAFKYALFRSLKAMIADPTVFQAFTGGATPFDEHYQHPTYDDLAASVTTDDLVSEGELGIDWIRGDTANFPFDRLTPDMRLALKLRYEHGLNEAEAAQVMGLQPRELRSLVHKARTLLTQAHQDAETTPDGSPSPKQAPPAPPSSPPQRPEAPPQGRSGPRT